MRLRRLVDELVGTGALNTSDTAPDATKSRNALDEAGHLGLDPELFGEALVHYADTAAIEIADALAPIVIDASVVPFDRELDAVEMTSDTASVDVDPEEFDEADRADEDQANEINASQPPEPLLEPDEADGRREGFGAGAGAVTEDATDESGDYIGPALDAPDEQAFDTPAVDDSTWAVNEVPLALSEIDPEPDDDAFDLDI
ncbi:MAG: hypothetical protein P8O03_11435 [Ilumatobacter sp.]|nr:hypothetical protein [Ilumatobacter sp.]